jgi:hypothetical protein
MGYFLQHCASVSDLDELMANFFEEVMVEGIPMWADKIRGYLAPPRGVMAARNVQPRMTF